MSLTFHCPEFPGCGCAEGGEKPGCPGTMRDSDAEFAAALTGDDTPPETISVIDDDIAERAYDEADALSDIYGCDGAIRTRLTAAFEQAIQRERNSNTAAPSSSPATAAPAAGIVHPAATPPAGQAPAGDLLSVARYDPFMLRFETLASSCSPEQAVRALWMHACRLSMSCIADINGKDVMAFPNEKISDALDRAHRIARRRA